MTQPERQDGDGLRKLAKRCRGQAANIGHNDRSINPVGLLLDVADALEKIAATPSSLNSAEGADENIIRRNYAASAVLACISEADGLACAGGSAKDVADVLRERFSDAPPKPAPLCPKPPCTAYPECGCQMPAPDAMREALKQARDEIVLAIAFLGRDVETERQPRTVRQLIERLAKVDKAAIAALSAPVPSPDGAGEIERLKKIISDEWGSHLCYRNSTTTERVCTIGHCRCADIARAILANFALSPATGAAEADATQQQRTSMMLARSTAPTVRGDREALECVSRLNVCADFAEKSPDTKTYLNDPARDLLKEAARLLAIPAQSSAGERGSDAAEADRYFEMAGEFGNQLQTLAGVAQDAIDILAERKLGSPARSASHNARAILETALKSVSPSAKRRPSNDDTDRCIACDVELNDGDLVHHDASGGLIHAACCGPERESYTDADGGPLKEGDPIPLPWKYSKASPEMPT
jgi:hypothetical protein